MTGSEKWKQLCAEAAVEQNPERLLELITEINKLLEQREKDKNLPGRKPQ
jgi:hypothetical protein